MITGSSDLLLSMYVRTGITALVLSSMIVLTGCDMRDNGDLSMSRTTLTPDVAGPEGSAREGRSVFWLGGCASCHATPGSTEMTNPQLGGGRALETKFGVFIAPNISPDIATGVGGWSQAEFANAMKNGVSPNGAHYYPSFPYTSYTQMRDQDISDLWAYLKTLPPVENEVAQHDMRFPYNTRGAAGWWKQLFFKPGRLIPLTQSSDEILRGQYLVEGAGHCAECHTPRSNLGGFDYARWMAGTQPDSDTFAPNITPDETGLAGWTQDDILEALEPSMTHAEAGQFEDGMEAVRRNLAELPDDDRRAIAAYLMALPAIESVY